MPSDIHARDSGTLVDGPTKTSSTVIVLASAGGFMAIALLGVLVHRRGGRTSRVKTGQAPPTLEISFGGTPTLSSGSFYRTSTLPSGSSDDTGPAPSHDAQETMDEGTLRPLAAYDAGCPRRTSRNEQNNTEATETTEAVRGRLHGHHHDRHRHNGRRHRRHRSLGTGGTTRSTRRQRVRFMEEIDRENKERSRESPRAGLPEPSDCVHGSGWSRSGFSRFTEFSKAVSRGRSNERSLKYILSDETLKSSNRTSRSQSESGSRYISDEDTQDGGVYPDWWSCGSPRFF